jgi:1-deoxy-D-xylulose-5-phosphate reductoisomerase
MKQQRVAILGSTGSIGENSLQVVRNLGGAVRVVGLAAGRRIERLAEQAAEFRPAWVAVPDAESARRLQPLLPAGCRALVLGPELETAVAAPDLDTVLCAIVGTAGLMPVLAAVRAGKRIALASKEVLVMAGGLVMAAARQSGARLIPVDSEHSAIYQCLEGRDPAQVRRLILTASGGPFRELPLADLEKVTPAQALKHPTWVMGNKITIDSATLMNKGLELIEAHWLFDVSEARIDVVVHPQSVIHSMVEFIDGSILAQMSLPNMCLPIQYALTWPERCQGMLPPLDFAKLSRLDFLAPDTVKFPALELARAAIRAAGTLPAVYNAANEVAVARFVNGEIPFAGIWRCVDQTMSAHVVQPASDLDSIVAADAWARRQAAAR